MFLKLFHLSVIVLYLYTIWYDQMYVELPFPAKGFELMAFKARHAFLTIWCLVLQIAYFTLSLLNDIFGTNDATPRRVPLIRKVKDTIFSLALPVAIYVTIVFWTIFTINEDLILPKGIVVFPKWVNHVMHSAVAPLILIELLVTKRNYPPRKLGINIMIIFMLAYTVWQHVLYFKVGVWMYPFLDVWNWPIKTMFYAVSAGSTVSMYFLGEKINYLVSSIPAAYTNTNDVSKKKQ